jgi:hypothetical protein
MIGQYSPNNNKTATIAFRSKFYQINSLQVAEDGGRKDAYQSTTTTCYFEHQTRQEPSPSASVTFSSQKILQNFSDFPSPRIFNICMKH